MKRDDVQRACPHLPRCGLCGQAARLHRATPRTHCLVRPDALCGYCWDDTRKEIN